MDEKTLAAFPTGKPREDQLEKVICKHCKRPVLKQAAAEHIRGCLKAKQEKARKKKEARDAANRAKEKASDNNSKDGDEGNNKADDANGEKAEVGEDAATTMKGQKSAKKSAVKGMAGDDGPKKGKKRKAGDGGAAEEDKDNKGEPSKKKKKKEEPKPKVPKPKGPVDVEKQCGVTLPNGQQCARSLTCKSHSMGAKRAVPGRSLPYDMLLQAYQKKNQARQQSTSLPYSLLLLLCAIYRANSCLQKPQSTPTPPSKTTTTTTAPSTRTRRKKPSWPPSPAPVPSPSSRTPSCPHARSISTSG